MSDEFTNNVAQKFPNTLNKEPIERPWDVAEPKSISPLRKPMEEPKKNDSGALQPLRRGPGHSGRGAGSSIVMLAPSVARTGT